MLWVVEFAPEFASDYDALDAEVQDRLLTSLATLKHFGPSAKRPLVDTLKGSKHSNMKELRFDAAGGAWRVAFAFDPRRRAIVLVAGDKSGEAQGRFYRRLIEKADARFDAHLGRLGRTQ